MLHCEFHPGLVEQAAFLAARRAAKDRLLRDELDAAYKIMDLDLRDESFALIHGRWFVKLGLDHPIRTLIAEQPLIACHVGRCHVREAAGRRRENVELFVRAQSTAGGENERTLIIQLCPESLLETDRLSAWLRRELFKIADMLDDAFAYSPILPAVHRSRQNLIRDRYRVLWDAYVHARLRRTHPNAAEPPGRLRERFERAFGHGDSNSSAACLDLLLQMTATTHTRLLGWAIEPQTLPGCQSHGSAAAHDPGELCPLCRFPTYDWYDFAGDVRAELQHALASAQPAWRSDQGACRQCVETYAAVFGGKKRGEMTRLVDALAAEWTDDR